MGVTVAVTDGVAVSEKSAVAEAVGENDGEAVGDGTTRAVTVGVGERVAEGVGKATPVGVVVGVTGGRHPDTAARTARTSSATETAPSPSRSAAAQDASGFDARATRTATTSSPTTTWPSPSQSPGHSADSPRANPAATSRAAAARPRTHRCAGRTVPPRTADFTERLRAGSACTAGAGVAAGTRAGPSDTSHRRPLPAGPGRRLAPGGRWGP